MLIMDQPYKEFYSKMQRCWVLSLNKPYPISSCMVIRGDLNYPLFDDLRVAQFHQSKLFIEKGINPEKHQAKIDNLIRCNPEVFL